MPEDTITDMGQVPGLWIRQSTGTIITQLRSDVFKETRLGAEGYGFLDFHREVPNDAVPLYAEIHPNHLH